MSERIGVLGAGSWGTALANLLAKKGHDVLVWSFEADVADTINSANENTKYMKGIALDRRVKATTDANAAVDGADGYAVWVALDEGPAVVGTTIGSLSLTAIVPPGVREWFVETKFEGCPSTESTRRRVQVLSSSNCGAAVPSLAAVRPSGPSQRGLRQQDGLGAGQLLRSEGQDAGHLRSAG